MLSLCASAVITHCMVPLKSMLNILFIIIHLCEQISPCQWRVKYGRDSFRSGNIWFFGRDIPALPSVSDLQCQLKKKACFFTIVTPAS